MRALALLVLATAPLAAGVFPVPREMRSTGAPFALDENVMVAVQANASPADLWLAGQLTAELSDRFGLAVRTGRMDSIAPGRRAIVMGVPGNPLMPAGVQPPGPEGYVLDVTAGRIAITGSDPRGAFYGFQTLRQLLAPGGVPGVSIRDWPHKPFRGIKMYLPGRNNIPFFKRFVRDFMALYKYNKLILEMNAGMRLDRHPELNAGWMEFARDLVFSRRDRPSGVHRESQDSSHQDTADGGVLEKDEVADLVRWAAQFHIEVIPELPALTHSYYLLTRHRELAENADAEWPDTYCPSRPQVYDLLFDVLDEYIEVMKPAVMHLGHDEWRVPYGPCPRCRERDFRELFAEDVKKIHRHLASRGVRMAIWGDHLIEPLRGAGLVDKTSPSGHRYKVPGALTPEQVKQWIPKDILIFNWFWDESYGKGLGEENEVALEAWGFRQVYGNMAPGITSYGRRSARASVLGGAPSSWAASTEFNFGKDLMYDFLGCANLLWATEWPDREGLAAVVEEHTPAIRRFLGGSAPASDTDPVTPVALRGSGQWPAPVKNGRVTAGRMVFELTAPAVAGTEGAAPAKWPLDGGAIRVGEDATSLIFLHAAVERGASFAGHRWIYNFADVADLLGWYEVVYEDGYVESVPIRYQVNILEWNRPRGADAVCYAADAVELGAASGRPVTFYAFEWPNPRLGKVIREVRLKGSRGFRRVGNRPIDNNGILLGALSVVKKRAFPDPVRAR